MGWLKRDEEDFDDSAAFDSDKGAALKIFLIVVGSMILIGALGYVGYNQYQKMNNNNNETNLTIGNTTVIFNQPPGTKPGEIMVNFTTFNASVKPNPQGLYYYTSEEAVIGENCYINGLRKDCRSMTDSVCSTRDCRKDLVTETRCYVNNEKIDCPDE